MEPNVKQPVCPCYTKGDHLMACPLHAQARAMLDTIRVLLPMAEAYLRHAPSHPDNATLEDARAILRAVTEGN